MGDLPVAPSIGEKRARGDDDHEDDAGNNVPPNLRGRTENSGQNNMNETAQAIAQRWQAMPPANNGLDALYLGELNWVCVYKHYHY
jgi:hypothetical protein